MDQAVRRKTLWIEVAIVVLWLVVPPLVTQLLPRQPSTGSASVEVDLLRALTKVGQIAALVFVMWRSGDSLAKFGLIRDKIGRVLTIAAVILALDLFVEVALSHRFVIPFPRISSFERRGWANALTVVVTTTCNSSFEELLFRAYLITRLEELLGDKAYALVITFVGFGCMHIYEGTRGFIGTGIVGLVLGIAFLRFRSFAPLALGHTLTNICLFFSD